MGNWYCNFTTHGPSREDIVHVLNEHRRIAYVSPNLRGNNVVYERASDRLDENEIRAVGAILSNDLSCNVLAVAVAHDDELWLARFDQSGHVTEYSSRGPNRGARAVCIAFEHPWRTPGVWLLFQMPFVVYESLRHLALTKLLGIPSWSVSSGYRYISQQDFPDGLSEESFIETGRKE